MRVSLYTIRLTIPHDSLRTRDDVSYGNPSFYFPFCLCIAVISRHCSVLSVFTDMDVSGTVNINQCYRLDTI